MSAYEQIQSLVSIAFTIADAINYLINNNVTLRRYHSLLLLCYASLSTLKCISPDSIDGFCTARSRTNVALREHWKQKRDWRKRCGYLELWSKTSNDSQHYMSRGGDDSAIWDRR
jgi:hypothetical protein